MEFLILLLSWLAPSHSYSVTSMVVDAEALKRVAGESVHEYAALTIDHPCSLAKPLPYGGDKVNNRIHTYNPFIQICHILFRL